MLKRTKIILISFLVFSCGISKKMNASEYITWYNSSNNPLQLKDTLSNEFEVYLRQLTPQYFAAQCQVNNCLPNDSIKEILKKKPETMDFQLKYVLPEKNMFSYNYKSSIHSSERMEYYAFDFKRDILLITKNNDTIDCAGLFFERGLTESPVGVFEFSFSYMDVKNISQIEIKNRALSNNSTVFKITDKTTELPKLKIK